MRITSKLRTRRTIAPTAAKTSSHRSPPIKATLAGALVVFAATPNIALANLGAQTPSRDAEIIRHEPGIIKHEPGIIKHAPGIIKHAPGIIKHAPEVIKHAPENVTR